MDKLKLNNYNIILLTKISKINNNIFKNNKHFFGVWLNKVSNTIKNKCSIESFNYFECVNKKGYNINHFECDKEFQLLKKCINANNNNNN